MKGILLLIVTLGITFTGLCQSSRQTARTIPSSSSKDTQDKPAREKVREAKQLLLDARKQLAREGKYSCCIQDPCNQCLLDHQSCACERAVKAAKAVCPECYGGWQRGEGKIKAIKPSDVKTEFRGHQH